MTSSAQPGGGHPLRLSVQLVYQSAQLVESLLWVHVHNGGVEELAEIVLHLAGLFDNLLQLFGLRTGNETRLLKRGTILHKS